MPDVADQAPAAAEIVVSAEVDVARVLGTGDGEVVVDGEEVFQREELPGAADVQLLVVDFAAGDRTGTIVEGGANPRGAWRVCSGVVVVNEADVEADVAEGFLPPAVEVHFDIAAREARALADVRVPVTEVDAARMGIVKAALDRRLLERLRDST